MTTQTVRIRRLRGRADVMHGNNKLRNRAAYRSHGAGVIVAQYGIYIYVSDHVDLKHLGKICKYNVYISYYYSVYVTGVTPGVLETRIRTVNGLLHQAH